MTEQHSLDPKQVRRQVYSAIHSLDRMSGTALSPLHRSRTLTGSSKPVGNKQSPSWTEAKPHATIRQAIG